MKFVRYMLTAMGLGLAGGGIYLILGSSPEDGVGKYLPAAILLLFAFLTFKVWLPAVKDIDHGDLLRTGDAGMATVVAVDDTGTRINDRPVFRFTLDVAGADGETRRVATKEITSFTSIGGLRPGIVVPVRVDRDEPTKVAIDWQQADLLGTGSMPAAGPGAPDVAGTPPTGMNPGHVRPVAGVVHGADVVRDGASAEATVQMVSLTGMTFGQMRPSDADESTRNDPMVMLALLVNAADGSTFTAQGVHRVPQEHLSEMTPGGTVPVAYSPDDPTGTTCVAWERM